MKKSDLGCGQSRAAIEDEGPEMREREKEKERERERAMSERHTE